MTCCSVQPAAAPANRRSHCRAFTVVELLVTIAIIALLATLILGAVSRIRSSAQSVKCLSNLRQIASAFQVYASNNGGKLPDPLGDAVPWETAIQSYINSDEAFHCPADHEVFPAVGSSYDWRDTGERDTTLAGRNLSDARGDAVLAFESLPGWHTAGKINVVWMNGSAGTLADDECFSDLTRAAQVGR